MVHGTWAFEYSELLCDFPFFILKLGRQYLPSLAVVRVSEFFHQAQSLAQSRRPTRANLRETLLSPGRISGGRPALSSLFLQPQTVPPLPSSSGSGPLPQHRLP